MLKLEGDASQSRFCVLVDTPSLSAKIEKVPLFGWELEFLQQNLLRGGIHPQEVSFISGTKEETLQYVNERNFNVLFPLGERVLTEVTGKRSLDKWNLSPLDCLPEYTTRKCVPSFGPDRVRKQPELSLYWVKSFQRGAKAPAGEWIRKRQNFLLSPPLEQTFEVLESLKKEEFLSVDIETGRNQINTVGFAWSASDAIAIQVLPDRVDTQNHYRLWTLIAELLENPKQKKILQNFIYEQAYFSKYGIRMQGVHHDTMLCQKFLWPEFDQGLDNVGRFYTDEVYWKDDGKIIAEEGKKKDWGNIRDWVKHLDYNCKDTSNTYEACFRQKGDLKARGLEKLFYEYVMKLTGPVAEMCLRGLPVADDTRRKMQSELEEELKGIKAQFPEGFNPGSWQQKIKLLKAKGYEIPKAKRQDEYKESSDELALKKLRIKYPDDRDLKLLLQYAKAKKALSSYVDIELHDDGKLRYSLNITGTETLRFSSGTDPWGKGLNAQTLPKKYRKMFVAPEGLQWLQMDLKQAESRFVAYDSCDTALIEVLESGQDIHKLVALQILKRLGKPDSEYSNDWRQLGKKSGHGANYAMREGTFIDGCLKDMGVVLTHTEANAILESYHDLFPGIRKWHREIQTLLRRERKLTNPFGICRYFYGRLDDNTFREGYAYKPQSTIPAITNHLMLALCNKRTEGEFSFDLCLQVHDSLIMLVRPEELHKIAEYSLSLKWHPEVVLPAGRLIIPIDCEVGKNLGELSAWKRK